MKYCHSADILKGHFEVWASKTDYEKLYAREETDRAHIDLSSFSKATKDFCSTHNYETIVNISLGNDNFSQQLRDEHINVVSCNFQAINQNTIQFNILENDENQLKLLKEKCKEQNYLVTCFDVLEQIDIEDINTALENLYRLVGSHALFSVSTQPSCQNNTFHSTILPLSTWLLLLNIAGFDVLDTHLFNSEKQAITPENLHDGSPITIFRHWLDADIFHDIRQGNPNFILVKKRENANIVFKKNRTIINSILDINYRKTKRKLFFDRKSYVIAFNLHFFQDYINIRPILDVLKRENVIILIRKHFNSNYIINLYARIFSRWGIRYIIYERVDEIDWSALKINILFSAAESNVYCGHILSSQIVNAAKLHGIDTYLLQHGIWTLVGKYPIRFESNKVLCWCDEQKNFMERPHPQDPSKTLKVGMFRDGHVEIMGAPRFFDSRLPCLKTMLTYRLGIPQNQYDKTVLLATNLHWDMHSFTREQVSEKFRTLILQNPNVFFIIKLHPAESLYDYANLKYKNCLIVDDVTLATIDLTVGRLIAGVDAVISSLSTILLDAAIAGKKIILYETGNKVQYHYLSSVPLESLYIDLAKKINDIPSYPDFIRYYAGNSADNVYEVLSKIIANSTVYHPTLEDITIASYEFIVETLWIESVHKAL